MCHKLMQKYHCGCKKEIATTACPHALITSPAVTSPAKPQQEQQNQVPYPVSNPNSGANTPQSLKSTFGSISHAQQQRNTQAPYPVSNPNSGANTPQILNTTTAAHDSSTTTPKKPLPMLPAEFPEAYTPDSRTGLPSLRLSSPQTPSPGAGLPYSPSLYSIRTSTSSSSPSSPVSPPPHTPTSTVISAFPPDAEPNFCSYFFQRYTPQSAHPCLACYMKPEYTKYRERWMSEYLILHPGTKKEGLENMAGIGGIAARVAEARELEDGVNVG